EVADDWQDLIDKMGDRRFWYFSRFATQNYAQVFFQKNDVLVFGSETSGLPASITQPNQDKLLRIPTTQNVRSLNLATSVGISAYEAVRQICLI
ncbi:MAG: TrmH family RNA methyltransferase, partial [Planctomycetota bacterium]